MSETLQHDAISVEAAIGSFSPTCRARTPT